MIEPDINKSEEYKVKVHKKVPLRHVESMIDRIEPRNLILGFASFTKQSTKVNICVKCILAYNRRNAAVL